MSDKNKTGLISMCRKAGKLVMGMGNARVVFVASDLSEKSLKEVRYTCAKYDAKLYALGLTMDEIALGIGKRTGVLAMTDAGFAKSCIKGLDEIAIDREEFDL